MESQKIVGKKSDLIRALIREYFTQGILLEEVFIEGDGSWSAIAHKNSNTSGTMLGQTINDALVEGLLRNKTIATVNLDTRLRSALGDYFEEIIKLRPDYNENIRWINNVEKFLKQENVMLLKKVDKRGFIKISGAGEKTWKHLQFIIADI